MQASRKSNRKLLNLKVNHIFDLDRTFFRNNVSFSFYFYLLRRGIVPYRTFPRVVQIFVRYTFGGLNLEGIHAEIFRHVLKGLRLADLEIAAEQFLSVCDRMVRPVMLQTLLEAQASGQSTYLLSSSPDFLISRIASNFSFDRFAGTNYLVDKEGKLCEIFLLITGPKKKEIAKQWVENPSSAVAYSDSFEDLSLLEWVGCPIVVCPDRKLKKHALRLFWKIL